MATRNDLFEGFDADWARSIPGPGSGSRLSLIFDELPLALDDWYCSPDHMDLANEPCSDIQRDILRHAEQIYHAEDYLLLAKGVSLAWRPVRFVNFLWLMIGKGGGKDRTAALAQIRIAYLLMCLRQPQRYTGIGATSKIDMLNTATSEGQGEKIFFEELKGLLAHSPWFRGLYHPIAREIVYDKRIIGHSGNSREEAQEGMNILLGVLDEIDAFRTRDEIEKTARTVRGSLLNAQAIFDMMHTSASSRFPRLFKIMALSWPRFVGSFIWQAVDIAEKNYAERGLESRMYSVRATTWEANPTKSRDDYDQDYEDNPELSRARYECLPPDSAEPFFRNKRAIDQGFTLALPVDHITGEAEEPIEIIYEWGVSPERDFYYNDLGIADLHGVKPPEGWQVRFEFPDWFTCEDGYSRAVHIDTGITRDRLGFAMAHVRGWSTSKVKRINEETGYEEEIEIRRPLVTIDLVCSMAAPKPTAQHPRGEVELRWARRLIFELMARGFPIQRVTYDGFQSTDSIQILNAHGIESELFSLDRTLDGYDTAKMILYSGGHLCYPHELLQKELRALTIFMGRKVDHVPGGSKDCADAWAGAINGAVVLNEFGGMEDSDFWWPGKPEPGAILRGQARPGDQQPSMPSPQTVVTASSRALPGQVSSQRGQSPPGDHDPFTGSDNEVFAGSALFNVLPEDVDFWQEDGPPRHRGRPHGWPG